MNKREAKITKSLRTRGFFVLTSGWPDLLVLKNNRVYCCEVKSPKDKLRPNQETMHKALESVGLPCVVVSEVSQLKNIEGNEIFTKSIKKELLRKITIVNMSVKSRERKMHDWFERRLLEIKNLIMDHAVLSQELNIKSSQTINKYSQNGKVTMKQKREAIESLPDLASPKIISE